jgi:two-component system, LytTR family, response regulator
MYKCVIIDDEKRSVETLKIIVEQYFGQDLTIVGTANSVNEAFGLIHDVKPNIVFLDIEMPHGSGFDLLERFEKADFEVIFTTGFDHYAITAIKFSALDYLLKPINIEELREAIGKAKQRLSNKTIGNSIEHLIKNIKNPKDKTNKIPLPIINGFQFVTINTIVYCEADEDYTHVFLNDGQKLTVTKSIKDFEDLLTSYDFFRIHHSFLMNKSYIKKYIKGEGGTVMTELGNELPVSRRRKMEFLEWLNTF